MCGADVAVEQDSHHGAGSSPRVRSRPYSPPLQARTARIISACAEQTPPGSGRGYAAWDHLRVCGADHQCQLAALTVAGSSPRVRSRPRVAALDFHARGIISACAEQTSRPRATRCPNRDHLRVCGADDPGMYPDGSTAGSSPRVRSRPRIAGHAVDQIGIISACAEQTN